jgi:hypothetical protein
MKELDRGVTLQKATGMYARSGKSVLVVVIKPREVYKVKDLIKKYAPVSLCLSGSRRRGGGRRLRYSHHGLRTPLKQRVFRDALKDYFLNSLDTSLMMLSSRLRFQAVPRVTLPTA